MSELSGYDYETAIGLLARVANPTSGLAIPERKRLFSVGVAEMIGADIWIWSSIAINHHLPGAFTATCQIDGGWESEGERTKVHQALASEAFGDLPQVPVYQALQAGRPSTWLQEGLFSDREWLSFEKVWKDAQLQGLLLSYHPIDSNSASSVLFCRRQNQPDFGLREQQLVALLLGHVEWLHRHRHHPEAQQQVLKLSPRERQVLALMLNGESRKTIAAKLGIREHTVADYQKKLHRSFGVTSRAQLQAYFFHGGSAAPHVVAIGDALLKRVQS